MTGRPDPVAIRAAARQVLRAADDLDHDASVAVDCISRLQTCWTGSAALVQAGALADYGRDLRTTATLLRQVAGEATAVAVHLDRESADLARLEAQRVSLSGGATVAASHLGVRIAEVWSSIRCHQTRFAHSLDRVDLRRASYRPGRRMRTGPVRVPDLGDVAPGHMRTGPVRPIGSGPHVDLRHSGHLGAGPARRLLTVHRPVLLP